MNIRARASAPRGSFTKAPAATASLNPNPGVKHNHVHRLRLGRHVRESWNSDHWGRGGVSPVYPGDTGSDTSDTVTIDMTLSGDPPTGGPVAYLAVASVRLPGLHL